MRVKDLLLHLRLHWQLLLSPLYLWGFLLSGSEIGGRFWLVFSVFHVLFYGGATALNSYYDQDDGPVGGLWNPPPATRHLLYFAVAVQALGLVLMYFTSLPLFGLAVVMGLVGNGYSHPAVRLKANPWTSLLAVSVFQGMGGAAAGWLTGMNDWRTLFSVRAGFGMAVAFLVVTAFYPLTQLYQREQDAQRGDTTFAVRWGERCFPLAIACLVAAAALLGYLAGRHWGAGPALVAVLGPLLLAAYVWWWWRHYDETRIRENYVHMMRLGYLQTCGFLGFIVWQMST
jgi:1,4-dihydroxy-2-naphthoate octaprenyltransferase